ncbi:MAG TPA: sulfoxide reductase heme-binding subunit YedZ [Providencia sp.]|uniref:sulfite oxidase heme-binding subunit YedZ n=1 Tax=Providencia sp. TaxID=589 RepID=UPI000E93E03E|nr:protein-methionine-sulfoxide reductase heme-binding subunit MsrQ [Providencia sp.]MBP6080818.1 sulfoxide reductase heme-binding subunit YedZ [Providencia sp.]HBO21634.1 sulfoxide reductase heme-binding subunit YedZ [Providencia sp.]
MDPRQMPIGLVKGIFQLIALLPLAWLIYAINLQQLSADPAKDIQHFTGLTALRLLVLIAVIPMLAHYLKWNNIFQVRKLVGIWCFVWATLHLTSYLLLEIGWSNVALFFSEIYSRVYLAIGLICWLFLFVMAISSFNWLRVKLGKWWKRIHNLLYPVLLLVVLHFALSMKTITPEPFFYLAIILFAYSHRFLQRKINS